MRELEQVHQTLNANFDLFKLTLPAFLNIELTFPENSTEQDRQFSIVDTALHNYLASVKSVIDHGRALKRKLKVDTDLDEVWNAKVLECFSDVDLVVVQKLREYVQHRSTLPLAIEVNIKENDEEEVNLVLTKKELLKWDGWNVDQREYISNLDGDLYIVDLVDRYQKAANSFGQWLIREISRYYHRDLAAMYQLYDEYEKELPEFEKEIRRRKRGG